jgi:hypothetical protein
MYALNGNAQLAVVGSLLVSLVGHCCGSGSGAANGRPKSAWEAVRAAASRPPPCVAMAEALRALAVPLSVAGRRLLRRRLQAGLYDVRGGCGSQRRRRRRGQ